ncbi:MAG: 3-octaprenyl-4-hydroxybenzoate carboxy-lyase [Chloroflexi bacterium RBG_16_48_8]|nr:MAG: 3-octaprenyl-4-hydroxybenzoate carboxy-lyase [Chloroflexi bacterium RBG_16_48_8]
MYTERNPEVQKLIVGISGASGVILGIRIMEVLRENKKIETHLVLTKAARLTIEIETDWKVPDVEALANVNYYPDDVGASIASGSFITIGMLIAPCSIKTLSAVANSYDNDLLSRAADVQLKEGRPVILMLRDTPLHRGHLRLMKLAAENGCILMPPIPTFYGRPKTVDEIVDGIVGRTLLRLGIDNQLYTHWEGIQES